MNSFEDKTGPTVTALLDAGPFFGHQLPHGIAQDEASRRGEA